MLIPFSEVHALNHGRGKRRQKIMAVPESCLMRWNCPCHHAHDRRRRFIRQSFAFVNGEPSSFDLDLLGSDLLILAVITFSF